MLRGPVTGQRSDDDGVVYRPRKLWLGRGHASQQSLSQGSEPGWQFSGCKEGLDAGGAAHAGMCTRARTEAHAWASSLLLQVMVTEALNRSFSLAGASIHFHLGAFLPEWPHPWAPAPPLPGLLWLPPPSLRPVLPFVLIWDTGSHTCSPLDLPVLRTKHASLAMWT